MEFKEISPDLRDAIKAVLYSDDGLSIESEGTIYIRSLEGNAICAGTLTDDGDIDSEIEYGDDIETAVEWFISERIRLNHGSVE